MEKIINIDIKQVEDLVEKYNEDVAAKDLIDYILSQSKFINRKDSFKVIVDVKFETNIDITGIIKKSLKNEHLLNLKKNSISDIRQIFFLFFGIICLFLSTVIDNEIINEIILIGGWILIWEMLDLFLFKDTQLKRDQMMLKKLLRTEFIINKKVIKD